MSAVHSLYWFLRAYLRTRRQHFSSRPLLLQHQARLAAQLQAALGRSSPYYQAWAARPLAQWPPMDKTRMLGHFDQLNTAGLRLAEVWACALAGEARRDFAPTLRGYTVGMSSGTSGQRGVFVVSRREQAEWAGTLLARQVRQGLGPGDRVALLLRADSNLYHALSLGGVIALRYFDLFKPFPALLARLHAWRPSIVVAPPKVLREIAAAMLQGRIALTARAIAVAEVLEPADQLVLAQAFRAVGEIYQASEGFLGMRCEHGVLHLNEEDLLIEPDWLDPAHSRFAPIVTDLRRRVQPIVRYRLDDVLQLRPQPCPCGRATLALQAVEGRCDDQLLLPGAAGGQVTVFADVLSRALAQVLPPSVDYRLWQRGSCELLLQAPVSAAQLQAAAKHLDQLLAQQLVAVGRLRWKLERHIPPSPLDQKRRRIRRLGADTAEPS